MGSPRMKKHWLEAVLNNQAALLQKLEFPRLALVLKYRFQLKGHLCTQNVGM